MTTKPRIAVVIGSTRPGRYADKAAGSDGWTYVAMVAIRLGADKAAPAVKCTGNDGGRSPDHRDRQSRDDACHAKLRDP
jgi:hypothetical protein